MVCFQKRKFVSECLALLPLAICFFVSRTSRKMAARATKSRCTGLRVSQAPSALAIFRGRARTYAFRNLPLLILSVTRNKLN